MHYWQSVLNEVLNKDDDSHTFLFTNQGNLSDHMENYSSEYALNKINKIKESRDLRMYYLGDEYPDVYLTKREAECMFWVAQGCTITETALAMQLSGRTVEFYVKKMKLKLNCASKKELIEKILQTNLLQQLAEEGVRVVKH